MLSINLNRSSIALIMIAALWSTIIISTELCPVPVATHHHQSPYFYGAVHPHRRVARQAPLYSPAESMDPRDSSRNVYGRRLNRLPSGPPPQRTDYYGVGGLLPQGSDFSTPEHRLITNRNPSIVTVMENTMSRVLLPFTQLIAPAPTTRTNS